MLIMAIKLIAIFKINYFRLFIQLKKDFEIQKQQIKDLNNEIKQLKPVQTPQKSVDFGIDM